jgi:predicted DNA-binding protein (MmcQ/YjbR family)
MDIEQFRDYCLSFENTSEKMPFEGFFRNSKSILVFYTGSKMFCLFDIDSFESITVKCKSSEIEELKEKYSAISKPFNLSHKHWVSVKFNEDLSDNEIKLMVKNSYQLASSS